MEFPRVITSSMRESFSRCEAKCHYETIIGLVPKGPPNVHLNAGGAYAAGLEAMRKIFFLEGGDYDTAVAAGLEALIQAYGPSDPPPEEKKTLERVIAAYIEYLVTYPPATDHAKPTISSSGLPRVEFSFTWEIPGRFHPVTNEPLLYSARLDKLVDFNGALFVFDDKTTGSIGKYWRQQWDLRSQITGYVYSTIGYGYDVVGAIIRGMAILKEKCTTQEAITTRPAWMLERWHKRLLHDVDRMLWCWNNNYWPTSGEESGACTTYGLCNFYTLCTSEAPEHYIDVYYDRMKWDPIAREMRES